jgi:hypothetical protein
VSGNLPNAPVNFLAYDQPNDALYAATDLGVFSMQNGVPVWTRLGDNLPNTATEDLKLQASSGKLYVGTFGRGTWRIPLVATSTCSVKITNGGSIVTDAGDRASFGGNAQLTGKAASLKGEQTYEDVGPAAARKVKSIELLATSCTTGSTPRSATIWGSATVDRKGSTFFRIDVTDAGTPGKNDTYGITMSDGYASGQQQLEGGNVRIEAS